MEDIGSTTRRPFAICTHVHTHAHATTTTTSTLRSARARIKTRYIRSPYLLRGWFLRRRPASLLRGWRGLGTLVLPGGPSPAAAFGRRLLLFGDSRGCCCAAGASTSPARRLGRRRTAALLRRRGGRLGLGRRLGGRDGGLVVIVVAVIVLVVLARFPTPGSSRPGSRWPPALLRRLARGGGWGVPAWTPKLPALSAASCTSVDQHRRE